MVRDYKQCHLNGKSHLLALLHKRYRGREGVITGTRGSRVVTGFTWGQPGHLGLFLQVSLGLPHLSHVISFKPRSNLPLGHMGLISGWWTHASWFLSQGVGCPSAWNASQASLLTAECVCVLSHVWLFVAPWTVASQASPSVGFPRTILGEYWSGLSFPTPGDLPNPGTDPESLTPPALARGLFTTSASWEACYCWDFNSNIPSTRAAMVDVQGSASPAFTHPLPSQSPSFPLQQLACFFFWGSTVWVPPPMTSFWGGGYFILFTAWLVGVSQNTHVA